MMTKTIEIRDAMTFIPALAIRLDPGNAADEYLFGRIGFDGNPVLLVWLSEGRMESDPFAWRSRTFSVAHKYIIEHFDELASGAVVDVEYILGLTKAPKTPERLSQPYFPETTMQS